MIEKKKQNQRQSQKSIEREEGRGKLTPTTSKDWIFQRRPRDASCVGSEFPYKKTEEAAGQEKAKLPGPVSRDHKFGGNGPQGRQYE